MAELKEEKCELCNGEGYLDICGESIDDADCWPCPDCDGTGFVEIDLT